MTANDLAWKIIDEMVANDYDDRDSLVEEVGDLNDYAYRLEQGIEQLGLLPDARNIRFVLGELELNGYA